MPSTVLICREGDKIDRPRQPKPKSINTMSNFATNYGKIVLIFIRPNREDDVLKITPSNSDNTYEIEYTQNSINNTVYTTLRQNDLENYLDTFLQAVSMDEDSPASIQIDVPSFPSVMIKSTNILNYTSLLFDQISSIQDEWPMEISTSKAKRLAAAAKEQSKRQYDNPYASQYNTHEFY